MGVFLTHEFVFAAYYERDILLKSHYTKSALKNSLQCQVCDHHWEAAYDNFSKTKGCPKCSYRRTGRTLALKHEFVEKAYLEKGIKLLSPYISTCAKNDLLCLECDHNWQSDYDTFYLGCGCPNCANRNLSVRFKGTLRPDMKGSKNWNYNPNLTDQDRKTRDLDHRVVLWRRQVRERDQDLCQSCLDPKKTILNSHHINCWSKHKEQRFNVSNGITLCKKCHVEYHSFARKIYQSWGDEKSLTQWFLLKS